LTSYRTNRQRITAVVPGSSKTHCVDIHCRQTYRLFTFIRKTSEYRQCLPHLCFLDGRDARDQRWLEEDFPEHTTQL